MTTQTFRLPLAVLWLHLFGKLPERPGYCEWSSREEARRDLASDGLTLHDDDSVTYANGDPLSLAHLDFARS